MLELGGSMKKKRLFFIIILLTIFIVLVGYNYQIKETRKEPIKK